MPIIAVDPHLKVSYGFIQFVQSNNHAIMCHLYQFISPTGATDYFTDLDRDVVTMNQTWKSGSLRFEGIQRKLTTGFEVDEQQITIWATPTDTLFGSAFLSGAEQGLLDGCIVVRYRAVWQFATGNVYTDTAADPIVCFPLFTGYTADITEGGATHIKLKLRSGLSKLEVNIPQNYYQGGCLWTLFGTGCTLSKAAHTITGTVGAGSSNRLISVSGGIATEFGADGIANYVQGRLLFTSGINAGLQVLIDNNDAANLALAYTLTNIPAPGDGILYVPGCSKSFATCTSKWANQANWRGFDKVPPVMVSM